MAEDDPEAPPSTIPELYLPHQIQKGHLQRPLNEFIGSIRFRPPDLTLANLTNRLEKIYWPMWLVVAEVEGQWEAEIGMDYDVVSHQERFGDGAGWQTREVKETRIRWEPRVGFEEGLRRTADWMRGLEDREAYLASSKKFGLNTKHSVSAVVACYKDAQAIPIMHERLGLED